MDNIDDMDTKQGGGKSEDSEFSLKIKKMSSNLYGRVSRTLGLSNAPTKVYAVNWNDYLGKEVLLKEGMFYVFAVPPDSNEKDSKYAYEVVINAESFNMKNSYSLLRTTTEKEAVEKSCELNMCLPCLIESCLEDVYNTSMLQKLLDTLRKLPAWRASHLVAQFELLGALKHEKVLSELAYPEPHNGYYPIHIAVENEKEKVINALLNAGASTQVFDGDGNSPLHLAASKSISLIQCFLTGHSGKNPTLNKQNSFGETPLLLAAKSGKLDNIKYFISNGANINHEDTVDPKTENPSYVEKAKALESTKDISHKDLYLGGSLLHWAKTKEITNLGLDMGCHPDLVNTVGETPLHIMVRRERVTCLMALLCGNASPNIVDKDGNSPLHLAADQLNITIVQALICFGADVDLENKFGETARHRAASKQVKERQLTEKEKVIFLLHAVGAKRCRIKMASCSQGCIQNGHSNGIPLYETPVLRSRWVFDDRLAHAQNLYAIEYQRKFLQGVQGRVLCLDGGGIKGLVSCQMLNIMEEVIGKPINECFDWITGTSTGGFLALNIALGRPMVHMQNMYYNLKEKVFVGNRPYEAGPLEDILKQDFGEEALMSSIKKVKVNVTTTLADRLPAELHIFRNYESPMEILGVGESDHFLKPPPYDKQPIWLAARASGAAPTYFRATDKFIDGGLIANNPVLDTLTEISERNFALKSAGRESEVFTPTVVVSLGCGKIPVAKVDNVDLALPSILDMRKGMQAAYNMIFLLVDQACASEGRVVDRARAWCADKNIGYFRFNPPISQDLNLDECSDSQLSRVMWEARSYMKNQKSCIDQLKQLLCPQSNLEIPSDGNQKIPPSPVDTGSYASPSDSSPCDGPSGVPPPIPSPRKAMHRKDVFPEE